MSYEQQERSLETVRAKRRSPQPANQPTNRSIRGVHRSQEDGDVILEFEKPAPREILSQDLTHQVDIDERGKYFVVQSFSDNEAFVAAFVRNSTRDDSQRFRLRTQTIIGQFKLPTLVECLSGKDNW